MSVNTLIILIKYFVMAPLIALTALFVCAANAEITITCPMKIFEEIEESVVLVGSGNCYLTSGAKISNDVSVSAGVSFIVTGIVEGRINEIGAGHVEVTNGGIVKGEIFEIGKGSLRILNGGIVEGRVEESGAGGVQIFSSVVKGDVEESGAGQVEVNASTVKGDVLEGSAGSVEIIASVINRNVGESGNGHVIIDSSSYVKGNVTEKGQGTCKNTEYLVIEGNINCD